MTVALASALAAFVTRLLGDVLVPYCSSNLTLVLVGISALIAVGAVANLVVTVVADTLFPLLRRRRSEASTTVR